MIVVSERSPSELWKRAFSLLYTSGIPIAENGFYRNDAAALELCNTSKETSWYTPLCPLSKLEIATLSNYLVNGGSEVQISHEWTKIYRRRVFEESNQVGRIIALLADWPDCPRAQISIWNPECDYVRSNPAPCLQILWFKIIGGRLDLHVHMRTTDCYGKLLMNVNEFLTLQHFVAGELNLPTGVYRQFVDSLHFHAKDASAVDALISMIKAETT